MLLISGGIALDRNEKVCTYTDAGGADEASPIFLFSTLTVDGSTQQQCLPSEFSNGKIKSNVFSPKIIEFTTHMHIHRELVKDQKTSQQKGSFREGHDTEHEKVCTYTDAGGADEASPIFLFSTLTVDGSTQQQCLPSEFLNGKINSNVFSLKIIEFTTHMHIHRELVKDQKASQQKGCFREGHDTEHALNMRKFAHIQMQEVLMKLVPSFCFRPWQWMDQLSSSAYHLNSQMVR